MDNRLILKDKWDTTIINVDDVVKQFKATYVAFKGSEDHVIRHQFNGDYSIKIIGDITIGRYYIHELVLGEDGATYILASLDNSAYTHSQGAIFKEVPNLGFSKIDVEGIVFSSSLGANDF
jgi:phage gp37-like protein